MNFYLMTSKLTMTKGNKNRSFWILMTALLISAGIWALAWRVNQPGRPALSARVFQTAAGWGYDILVNDSLLIHQETMPVTGGGQGFAHKEWAEKASRLIINKMENGRHPRLTSFDMAQICEKDTRIYDKQGTPE